MSTDIIPFDEAQLRKKCENLLYVGIRYLADGAGQGYLRPEDRDDFAKAAWRLRTGRNLTQAEERAAWRRLRKYEEVLDGAGIPFEKIPEPSWPCEAVRLIEMVEDNALLFHTPERQAFAVVPVAGHLETLPLRGSRFGLWLRSRFRAEVGKTPSNQAVADALHDIEATAIFSRPEEPVFVRLAAHKGSIYLDLGNEDWEAVEITADGWRIVPRPPVNFRRPRGMAPLPRPERSGSVDELRRFVNVLDEQAWVLLVGWLVAALRPRGPYPVATFTGEQGSAKTTTARVLRALIDPCIAAVRTTPRNERDLAIAANNTHVLAFDNLSGLPDWLSDALARVATGGGYATRELYTNSDEAIFDFVRPIILNGIEDVISRQDLLDRAILFNLPPIPEDRRRPEETFWREFEEARPRILGGLLDAVAEGLRNIESVKLDKLPRMADFARWVVACEPALPWKPGAFMEAYAGNRAEAVDLALESDLVASAIRELLTERDEWSGTATELLENLGEYTTEQQRKSRAWPKTARGLAGRVRRAATFLRTVGIDVQSTPTRARQRIITLRWSMQATSPASPTSPPGAQAQLDAALDADASGDVAGDVVGATSPRTSPTAPLPRPSIEADLTCIGDVGDVGDVHSESYLEGPAEEEAAEDDGEEVF